MFLAGEYVTKEKGIFTVCSRGLTFLNYRVFLWIRLNPVLKWPEHT